MVPAIFDLPHVRAANAKTLDEAIADEVRRDAATHESAGMVMAAALAGGDDAGLGVDDAVVAAHDARIAFLTQRIAALASTDAAQLGGLRARLHRAEAARRLALARARSDGREPGCAREDDAAMCGPTVAIAAVNDATSMRSSGGGRSARPRAHGRAPNAAENPAAGPRSSREAGVARRSVRARIGGDTQAVALAGAQQRQMSGASLHARLALLANTGLVTGGEVASRHSAGQPPVADASGHVRGLLAAARKLLEADVPQASHAAVKLAGLMQWDGSDTWSLANCPKPV